jgi:integrase
LDPEGFRAFLLAGSGTAQPRSRETARNYVDALERFVRDYAFSFETFSRSEKDALTEGSRILTRLRAERDGPNAYNLGQKALNALAQACNWGRDVHWRKLPENKTQPRPFTDHELRRILSYESPRPGWAGKQETSRRRAMFWVAIFTAMRHGEIHRLRVSHLDPVALRYTIRHPSKNGAVRTLDVEPEFFSTGRPLTPWLEARPVVTSDPDAIWTTTLGRENRKGNRTHETPPRKLTYNQIGQELFQMGDQVGVDLNFYRTRAHRATMLKRAGCEDRTIQLVLGHAKLETTTRYVQFLMIDAQRDFQRHKPRSPIQRPRREDPKS